MAYYVSYSQCDNQHPLSGWYYENENKIHGPFLTKNDAINDFDGGYVDYKLEDQQDLCLN